MPEMRLLKLNEAGFAKRRALLEAQTKKNRPQSALATASASPAPTPKGKEPKTTTKKGEGSRKRGRDTGLDTVSSFFFFNALLENSIC